MIDHLINVKLIHWDENLRVLSAHALSKIAILEPQHFSTAVLEHLVSFSTNSDLKYRHGCTLAVALIIESLNQVGVQIEPKLKSKITSIVPIFEEKRLYRGKGGYLIIYF